MKAGITKMFGTDFILDKTEGHTDRYYKEAGVPVDILTKPSGDQWCQECAEVDPHIEDRES